MGKLASINRTARQPRDELEGGGCSRSPRRREAGRDRIRIRVGIGIEEIVKERRERKEASVESISVFVLRLYLELVFALNVRARKQETGRRDAAENRLIIQRQDMILVSCWWLSLVPTAIRLLSALACSMGDTKITPDLGCAVHAMPCAD